MRKIIRLPILLLIVLLLTGCSGKKEMQQTQESSGTKIYYIDSKTSKIVSEDYNLEATTIVGKINELLEALRKPPENMLYKNALPEEISIKKTTFTEDGRLTINFDTNYSSLTGIPEVLGRATIVKTLCQISEVEYIEFYVNDQPLMDSNGVVVGLMTEDDFIDSIESETNYQASLYFANREGDGLIEYVTNIYYTGTGTIEELVIKQLINGPTEIGMFPTIPEGTTLLNVTTKEGICYVDFNEKFLEKIPEIKDEIAIYSVVNSLVDLPNRNISKVQFLINGKVEPTYRESFPFNEFFERNLSLIESSK
jgi:germination protein M